ncbi:histidine phosphatase family protein [Cognatishimia sp. 1_MG-2023]|uniref:histidine phosphatase family protein n=1 Tax=Cognatishimia sp. 1_MG-2023 TaxID=3062642 RepID=UPI0026E38C0C|nr:histidine phosphatase family protein [Cognatishimia sp. 1_MG-2023]MDO6728308.1 histidine phosphatase family protein [Cognatishimia sp. 1_MG-2023]
MPQMTLIRHGQANTTARDELDYDKLSDLGHQQARWLGDYLAQSGDHYQRVFCGTMRRHIETAEGIGAMRYGEIVQDSRLNEFPYFSLEKAMQAQFNTAHPTSREEFAAHLPKVLAAWSNNELENVDETFAAFSGRVGAVIEDIAAGDGRALVITSGGLISTVLRQTLNLEVDGWSRMCMAIMNSSVHRWQSLLDRPILTQFNAVPHLETPDRHYAQTHL